MLALGMEIRGVSDNLENSAKRGARTGGFTKREELKKRQVEDLG